MLHEPLERSTQIAWQAPEKLELTKVKGFKVQIELLYAFRFASVI